MSLGENKKVDVIGINYKDTKNNAESFLNKLGNPYEIIIFDKEGIHAIEWGAYGVPESFLIHNNLILRKYTGPLNNELMKEIKLLIE
jgi:cytochrome c biogenesis protein CcmG/thiol:disulfide interchange protein DsbE